MNQCQSTPLSPGQWRVAPVVTHIHTHAHTQQHTIPASPNANKQCYSTLLHPDNGWLVWGVKSNKTGRSQQQLGVCVQSESRHKCPCQGWPREEGRGVGGGGRATLTAASRPRMAAGQNCRDGEGRQCLAIFCFSFLCSEPPDLLVDWCELIRAVPLAGGEAGFETKQCQTGQNKQRRGLPGRLVCVEGWNCAERLRLNLTGL